LFRLQPHEDQPADRHSEENVAELMKSIETHGLLQAPLVARRPDGKYVIIAGHRRIRALQLLVLNGRVKDEKIPVFLRCDLSDADITYMMCSEALHREEMSPVLEARIIGRSWIARSQELGRDASARDLADVLRPGKTAVNDALSIYRALEDPRLGSLVRQADSAGKKLLVKALRAPEFSTRVKALQAFQEGGATAARKVLSSGNGGRPQKPVSRRERGDGYDLTIHLRPTMDVKALSEVEEALRKALGWVQTKRGIDSCV